ncbi:hypothetical protein DBV08_14565 [Rhodococcus sp. KBW08]|uniref:hypothetical protein n=1 Tax=Rhodococcus sp. KBW08 TaxID=2144188 RepID=UPI000F59B9C3|nr:hypothetical protein [Rhodococcus sp. KBW08]RQO47310.1 hypothetical protein DBV08_14565 [Rhodococcus sp. KBW08]
MGSQSHHPESDVIRLAFGLAAITAGAARRTAGLALDSVQRIPVVGGTLDDAITQVTTRGTGAIRSTAEFADSTLRTVIKAVVDAALAEVDITKIVVDHVDIDKIAENIDVDKIAERVSLEPIIDRVDVDEIASRLDVKAVIDRLDLDGIVDTVDLERQVNRIDLVKIADQVIEGVDLPQMIRESTGSLSTEAVHGARVQGMQADDAVAGFVGRLFGRDNAPSPEKPSPEKPAPETDPKTNAGER